MMKLTSNDEIDKKKKLRKKKLVFRRRSWLIPIYQNISHQKIYTFWHFVVNEEVPSTSSQVVEQIQVIQEVVLPGAFKLNGSATDKKPKDQTQVSQKEDSRKRKMDLILPIIFVITPIDGLCYRVIDSSILQDFFSSVSKFLSCYEEKTVEKRQKGMDIVVLSCCSKILLCGIPCFTISISDSVSQFNNSKSNVPDIYKELMRRIIIFKYEKLQPLKSAQSEVASNIVITKQNKTSQTYHICQEHFEIKLLILQTNQ